jgi:type IV pilus biogenesis protein CpaD/CtpE
MSCAPQFRLCRAPLGIVLAVLAFAAVIGQAARAEDTREKLEAQYQSEDDPVQRAKILSKLGKLEIAESRNTMKTGEDEKSLGVLEHYRDLVRDTVQALNATGVNAERHPGGYKELQISLRQALRQLDDFISTIPYDKRPWFQAVRSDLMSLQTSLLNVLFPPMPERAGRKGV